MYNINCTKRQKEGKSKMFDIFRIKTAQILFDIKQKNKEKINAYCYKRRNKIMNAYKNWSTNALEYRYKNLYKKQTNHEKHSFDYIFLFFLASALSFIILSYFGRLVTKNVFMLTVIVGIFSVTVFCFLVYYFVWVSPKMTNIEINCIRKIINKIN